MVVGGLPKGIYVEGVAGGHWRPVDGSGVVGARAVTGVASMKPGDSWRSQSMGGIHSTRRRWWRACFRLFLHGTMALG
jgi:hypothetical protein